MMLLWCTNKGCYKQSEAKLNTADNEVYCLECDRTIANVPSFTKNALKTLNQTKSGTKKQAFSILCQACKKQNLPNYNGQQFSCANCNAVLTLSQPFQELIKKAIKEKQADKDIEKRAKIK